MRPFGFIKNLISSVALGRPGKGGQLPLPNMPPPTTFHLPDNLQRHHLGDRGRYRGRKHDSTTGSNRRRARCLDGGQGTRHDKKPGHRWEPVSTMLYAGVRSSHGWFKCRRCGEKRRIKLLTEAS